MYFPLLATTDSARHCDPLYLLSEWAGPRLLQLARIGRSAPEDSRIFIRGTGLAQRITVRQGSVAARVLSPTVRANASSPASSGRWAWAQGERLRMGYIGFLSDKAARQFDAIDLPVDQRLPDAQFVLPEVLFKVDHERHEITVIAHRDTKESIADIERAIAGSPFRDDRCAELRAKPLSGHIGRHWAAASDQPGTVLPRSHGAEGDFGRRGFSGRLEPGVSRRPAAGEASTLCCATSIRRPT